MRNPFYSLKKSKYIFFTIHKRYKKKLSKLSLSTKEELIQVFENLQKALVSKNREEASSQAKTLERLSREPLKKTPLDKFINFIGAIVFALIIAIIVRQMWFEFYEIPTGSMRPTFKEQDRLVVSKNQFSINIPLTAKNLYFDPALVQRGGIVVFTGQGMDIQDVDTMYFYLFPGKKQYIKRMIGKPGDTLYFYGGKLYGVDKNLKDITSELNPLSLNLIDHIPFISFEGRAITPRIAQNKLCHSTLIYQMNELVARMDVGSNNKVDAKMVKLPDANSKNDITSYSDLWGFKNYAMARILTKKEYLLSLTGGSLENLKSSDYYLELVHNPSLKTATIQRDLYGRIRPTLGLSKSYLPLDESHLQALFDNLYTARFIVDSDGTLRRYGYKKNTSPKQFSLKLQGIPAGTYEFYYGKAYQVLWQGVTKQLPKTHPIYTFTKEKAYMLFNLGIEFDLRFLQEGGYASLLPSRYAFFRDESLYVMGADIFKKEDPELINFVKQEKMKEHISLPETPYTPFVDHLSPLKSDGSLDIDQILRFGLTIPKNQYLVLGDNYAMSADSRDFGFVPQNNLRGVPDFIFWPPGSRFGHPNQPGYTLLTPPRVIIWVLAVIIIGGYTIVQRRKHRLPISFKEKQKN